MAYMPEWSDFDALDASSVTEYADQLEAAGGELQTHAVVYRMPSGAEIEVSTVVERATGTTMTYRRVRALEQSYPDLIV